MIKEREKLQRICSANPSDPRCRQLDTIENPNLSSLMAGTGGGGGGRILQRNSRTGAYLTPASSQPPSLGKTVAGAFGAGVGSIVVGNAIVDAVRGKFGDKNKTPDEIEAEKLGPGEQMIADAAELAGMQTIGVPGGGLIAKSIINRLKKVKEGTDKLAEKLPEEERLKDAQRGAGAGASDGQGMYDANNLTDQLKADASLEEASRQFNPLDAVGTSEIAGTRFTPQSEETREAFRNQAREIGNIRRFRASEAGKDVSQIYQEDLESGNHTGGWEQMDDPEFRGRYLKWASEDKGSLPDVRLTGPTPNADISRGATLRQKYNPAEVDESLKAPIPKKAATVETRQGVGTLQGTRPIQRPTDDEIKKAQKYFKENVEDGKLKAGKSRGVFEKHRNILDRKEATDPKPDASPSAADADATTGGAKPLPPSAPRTALRDEELFPQAGGTQKIDKPTDLDRIERRQLRSDLKATQDLPEPPSGPIQPIEQISESRSQQIQGAVKSMRDRIKGIRRKPTMYDPPEDELAEVAKPSQLTREEPSTIDPDSLEARQLTRDVATRLGGIKAPVDTGLPRPRTVSGFDSGGGAGAGAETEAAAAARESAKAKLDATTNQKFSENPSLRLGRKLIAQGDKFDPATLEPDERELYEAGQAAGRASGVPTTLDQMRTRIRTRPTISAQEARDAERVGTRTAVREETRRLVEQRRLARVAPGGGPSRTSALSRRGAQLSRRPPGSGELGDIELGEAGNPILQSPGMGVVPKAPLPTPVIPAPRQTAPRPMEEPTMQAPPRPAFSGGDFGGLGEDVEGVAEDVAEDALL